TQRRLGRGRQRLLLEAAHHVLRVALDERGDERLLAGEILIQRAHADAGGLGDFVRARVVVPLLDEDARGGGEDRVDGGAGALLARLFAGLGRGAGGHRRPREGRAAGVVAAKR